MKTKYMYYDCQKTSCGFRMEPNEVHTQFLNYLKKTTPKPNLLALFKAIVMDVWEDKYKEFNRESIEAAKRAIALKEEKRNILDLMKLNKDRPALLEALQEDFARVDAELTAATAERNEREMEEYDAEIVVTYCNYYLKHASELWDISEVEDQSRLQTLIFPDGIHQDSLEDKRTPKFSLGERSILGVRKW